MKQAVIYRRASTDEMKQANSLDNQSAMLWSFAEENDYHVIEDVVEYASASKGEREGFAQVVSLLSKNPDLYLIVNDLTRLSRDLGDWNLWSPFLSRIRFARKGDIAITELEASLLLVVASNESRVLGQRISEGIQRSKERALSSGKDWSWGNPQNLVYANQERTKRSNEWRNTIRMVCEMLDQVGQTTLQAKIDWLADNGFKSRRGNKIGLSTLHKVLKAA